jgi:hydroxyacyl-ACP dehydratase HTD2-like protein with hotdog domain
MKELKKKKQVEGEEIFIKKRKAEMHRNRSIVVEEEKSIVKHEVRSKIQRKRSVHETEMKKECNC